MSEGDACILGIDSSTTATKAVAWSRDGDSLGEGRCDIALRMPGPGRYEQNPDDWWESLCAALADLGRGVDLGRIDALAISNQRETVAFLSAAGEAVAPAIVWLDERARDTVDAFAARIGDDAMHRISGKHKDITPVVYRLAWLREHAPQTARDLDIVSDVQGFLVKRLTGAFATSWASADPMGCWDIAGKCWSEDILDALGWDARAFPAAQKPGSVLGQVTAQAAARTGLRAGTPVIAGGGDGQCAGLGVGIIRPGAAYLNIGTAVVCGAYQADYAWGKAWRTMTAMDGDGYILESCLRSGTFLLNWLVDEVFSGAGNGGDDGELDGNGNGADRFAALEARAAGLPPGADGVTVLPYWSGVMNPHWDSAARGAIFGLAGNHGRAHLYRAVLEGIALDQADCMRMLEHATGHRVEQYYAVGGGAQSDLWCQIFADCLARPVYRMNTVEASALGAGMAAAVGGGAYRRVADAADRMRGDITAKFNPGENAAAYARLLDAYPACYPAAKSARGST